ncbi:VOC family protein [Sporosarcina limicola]|uniref:Enzyme related to lactoylglutathione lyase n=1 Tax=Sporosarcina limicola TaxID=34101 RepID=A0A927MF63_9BACL|nr:VOC family protein [Sporosarcina limicola]MBE1553345.1 putative enzyme related to lactoylglutathione lyase [Sporosarcina limicola]
MSTISINKLGQIAIPAKDINRATAFYKDMLNLPLLFNTDTMAFFDCDGVRLLLSLPEQEQFATASSVLYFHVDDITGSYEELKSKGVSFTDEPHVIAKMGSTETWMVFFNDTEGNTHALMSEVDI